MYKKHKNNKNLLSFLLTKIAYSNLFIKIIINGLLIILTLILIISLISNNGTITSKIYQVIKHLFGWSAFALPAFLIGFNFVYLKNIERQKKIFMTIGMFLIFLSINFYLHSIFRQGGLMGYYLLSLEQYIGIIGLSLIVIFAFFTGLWLVFDNKLIEFINKILLASAKQIENSHTIVKNGLENIKINITKNQEPVKQVKKEISNGRVHQNSKNKLKIQKRNIVSKGIWDLPPIEMLTQGKEETIAPDIDSTSQIIEKTLANFNLYVKVVDVEIGPSITRFSLKPGEGIKLSKVLSYQSDIALALGTPNLIIETPIPGKSVIGIQVPNKQPANVRLGNLLRENEFLNNDELFIFPIGRKINGDVLFVDLAKLPHLLIAGATGTGKSIFVHDLLISLLMKNTPETLNLVLIDPKRVELINYTDIPHLLLDPIVDVRKSVAVFNWLLEEMNERYKLLEESRSRDIDIYNKKQIQRNEKILPRIVLIIDEMADLMMAFGSSVEAMIIRLAQMARATGIHLILATQRPSVDIVTGLIKANIPNRICFKVASSVDSRTVLDTGGAEKLIGSGDSLFISTTFHKPLRIKTPFISENEIKKITAFWASQVDKIPNFEKQTISIDDLEKKTFTINDDLEEEALLKEAINIVIEANKASTSLLQRRLKIGYARAARLLDLMEEKGIVGPQEGSKPRKILVNLQDNFKTNEDQE
ncbi:MAG: hypothetical protein KatS3mg097_319 [Candidatus Parcubacteria bacterium]|nr:MAG: hypothetical protein KatS3mg097_319 [Candidatus Parcubacteria bacterium]